jgi:hypothetical protein
MTMRDTEVQALIDKEKCRELTAIYARSLDRCDLEMMKSVFHADATFEHADHYNGSAAGFAEMAVPLMRSIGPVQHSICQHIVELDGDIAYGEAYGIAFQRVTASDGASVDCIAGARIFDRYERRNGTWKIAARRTIVDWNIDLPTAETWGRGGLGHPHMSEQYRGRKDRGDTVYEWFASLRR